MGLKSAATLLLLTRKHGSTAASQADAEKVLKLKTEPRHFVTLPRRCPNPSCWFSHDILLWWLEDHKSNELLEPVGLQVGAGLLEGRLILPHHFNELLLGLPERLLELQEDLVVGAKTQAANGLCFPFRQGRLEEVLVVFLEETCRQMIRQKNQQLCLLGSEVGSEPFSILPSPTRSLPIINHANWLEGTRRARKGVDVLTQWDGDNDVVSEESVSIFTLHTDGEIPRIIPFLTEGPLPLDGPHCLVEQDRALWQSREHALRQAAVATAGGGADGDRVPPQVLFHFPLLSPVLTPGKCSPGLAGKCTPQRAQGPLGPCCGCH